MRRADGEGAEPIEQRVAVGRLLVEEELKRTLGRLAELQRHERGDELVRELDPLHRERTWRALGLLHGLERQRGQRPAGESREHRALRLVAPDEAGTRSGRLGCERGHLLGRPRLVRARGQSVSGEAEQVWRDPGRAVVVAERPPRERDLVGGGTCEPALALVEVATAAKELERTDHELAVEHRQLQDAARPELLRHAPQRARQLQKLVSLLVRERAGPEPGALELRPQRGRGRMHGTCSHAAGIVGQPRDDHVRLRDLRRARDDLRERSVEAADTG